MCGRGGTACARRRFLIFSSSCEFGREPELKVQCRRHGKGTDFRKTVRSMFPVILKNRAAAFSVRQRTIEFIWWILQAEGPTEDMERRKQIEYVV